MYDQGLLPSGRSCVSGEVLSTVWPCRRRSGVQLQAAPVLYKERCAQQAVHRPCGRAADPTGGPIPVAPLAALQLSVIFTSDPSAKDTLIACVLQELQRLRDEPASEEEVATVARIDQLQVSMLPSSWWWRGEGEGGG